MDVFNDMGNPFTETSTDLLALDTKIIMADEVILSVKTAEDLGKKRMVQMTKPFHDTIPKNNFALLKSGQQKASSKSKAKISRMKSDLQLFSCQAREGEIDAFFEHENHAWPPSLGENNSMHHGNMADILKCLEPLAPRPETLPEVDVKVLDGAALVHKLEPKHATTVPKMFKGYAENAFLPYIFHLLQVVSRVDVVWDSYIADSLKAHVRQCRGIGNLLCVSEKTRIPQNWKTFLRVDSNKQSFSSFLLQLLNPAKFLMAKNLSQQKEKSVAATATLDVSNLHPCTHEEADYRMMLHCAHAHQSSLRKIMVHATDTDELVLAIATVRVLDGCEIWLAFGHGGNFRYIAVHTIATVLGHERSKGLLFMHAISGRGTVSSFSGIGKKTVWDIWKSLPNLTPLFRQLSETPDEITESDMEKIKRYVVLLYSRTSPIVTV